MQKEKRLKRLAILKKVDELLTKCDCVNSNLDCKNCIRLSRLGNQLLKLSTAKKPKNGIPINFDRLITIEKYNQYKSKGLTDGKIALKLGVSKSAFLGWKRSKGIAKQYRKSKVVR
ncbi:hypothetical protein [Metasolibacillus meyeri]|uniref:hypothetical protein n=1 Tax=Metasolibacillus meyeri TaxID=1071052 RepID=UPI000D2F6C40|nr:hypothetical protein [Metasolibacillus meyeri]